jgi:hypothetical protein
VRCRVSKKHWIVQRRKFCGCTYEALKNNTH